MARINVVIASRVFVVLGCLIKAIIFEREFNNNRIKLKLRKCQLLNIYRYLWASTGQTLQLMQ